MERIKIYTSRKKSFGVLILALIMTAGSAWLLFRPEDFKEGHLPFFTSIIGLIGVLFFGFGVFAAASRVLKKRLFLVIDDEGINVEPWKWSSEKIAWKHIEGFSEIRIGKQGSKLIVIHVNNPYYWIENERNAVRRKMMKFNLGYCGSPFGISATAARISHAELWKLLNDRLGKYNDTEFTGKPAR